VLLVAAPLSPAASHARIQLPDPPDTGLPLGQVFDHSVSDQDRAQFPGKVYFIWGAVSPKQPAGVVASRYLPLGRDPDRSHTLDWYQKNHPDWVIYQADHTTPAWGFTYANGNCMPLDIADPEVREFYFTTYVAPAVAEGFPVVAFDNAGITNWDHRRGRYDHGKWIPLFSGERVDQAYAENVIAWLEYLRDRLHTMGAGIAANIKCYDEPVLAAAALEREVDAVDIFCDEGGFTFHRDQNLTGDLWEKKVAFLQRVAARHVYFSISSMSAPKPAASAGPGEATAKVRGKLRDASATQVEYAIASFLLVRAKGSLLGLIGYDEHGVVVDRPELHTDLGAPLDTAARLPSGVWCRHFERGVVFVNPSSSQTGDVAMSISEGHWKTLRSGAVGGSLVLHAGTGCVLLRTD
jgi:hypothetical protein